jgi:signal transduction histidine kinase
MGRLLVRLRPQDPRAICFAGGGLSSLASGQPQASTRQIIPLNNDFGDDPFVVIAGSLGAIALLSWGSPGNYRMRLLTDPEAVDRAALVLSQFGDYAYNLDTVCDAESQRAFVASIIAGILNEPALASIDLPALMPDEKPWLLLAREILAGSAITDSLVSPKTKQLWQESGIARLLLGQCDSNQQQLTTLAHGGDTATPRAFPLAMGVLGSALVTRRTTVATTAAASGLDGEAATWLGSQSLTVVPLLKDDQVSGMVLATSDRPLSEAARANLNGLGALLAVMLSKTPPPVTMAAPAPPMPPLRNGTSMLANTPAGNVAGMLANTPQGNGTGSLRMPQAPAAPGSGGIDLRSRLANRAANASASPIVSHKSLIALMPSLHDAVVLADAQGRMAAASPAAYRLFGMPPTRLGQPLLDGEAAVLATLLTEVLVGDVDGPCSISLPNGSPAEVSIVGLDQGMWAFVVQVEGDMTAASAVSQAPVTEQERNENFLANFSNIIRVPLRELRNLITSVPAAGELNEQQSRLIGQVVKLNSEMTMLVNDLLALGQIRLQISENQAPLRLDLLIEAAVDTQYAEFGRRGQQVTMDIAPNLPRVSGSEEGLSRAVGAMIDNAIKYSAGGAHIQIILRREGDQVVFSITDTGVGLAADELAQVYDPFYRASSAEKLKVPGRGLGLTIAKTVVEQHNGRMWATSTPGEGSTFAFCLPCSQ